MRRNKQHQFRGRLISKEVAPCWLFVSIAKSNLHERQGRGVILLTALKGEQVIVRATLARRKFPTRQRPPVVNRAPTRFRIEEPARLAENRIFFAAQNLLALPGFSEALFCGGIVNREMARQTLDVTRRHPHALVNRATVRGTTRTVVVTS